MSHDNGSVIATRLTFLISPLTLIVQPLLEKKSPSQSEIHMLSKSIVNPVMLTKGKELFSASAIMLFTSAFLALSMRGYLQVGISIKWEKHLFTW